MSFPYYMPMFAAPGSADTPMRDRLLVVALVVLVHMLLLSSWFSLPKLSRPAHHEMSVSMDISSPDMPNPVRAVEPAPEPLAKHRHVKPAVAQAEKHAAPVEIATPPAAASTAPVQPVNAAPGLPDREPDYDADYLHNPKPRYPKLAENNEWYGRVVLNVEVLASGSPGQITVFQSSGHELLDNAALQAVRGWRFVPARRGGKAVTVQVNVPIRFDKPKEAE